MKTKLTLILATLCLTAAFSSVAAQEYVAPQVVISKEKIRSGGKVYYSHVVQARQTIYSISKAYGVTMEEIYDANPALKLASDGLKKDQILLIPYKEGAAVQTQEETPSEIQKPEPETIVNQAPATSGQDDGDYFVHKVKWYEDLDGIARKYGISKESIKNINRMTSDKLKRKQDLKIPRNPAYWEGKTVTPEEVEIEEPAKPSPTFEPTDTSAFQEEDDRGNIFDDLFVREGHHDVNISLLLPFSSPKSGDRTSFMDFYCGSLLAARVLGSNGTNLDIFTYDIGGGNIPIGKDRFSSSDFSIGPVSRTDVIKAAAICDEASWIVSPLDMQVESVTDSLAKIIQAPTPTSVQIADMVDWIKSDYNRGDKVLVVTPATPDSDYLAMVEDKMAEAGVPFTRTTLGSMHSNLSSQGTNRIVLACDYTERSTVFLIEAIRNLYSLSSRSGRITLYSTSKIRTYDQIDVEQLHKVNLHASVTYFVDYGSKEVKDFLLKYRALYNAEPSRSAYSGYDLMMYFSTLASKYGKRWPKALHKVDFNGLQSDFKLVRTHTGSYVNNAVRRVVYNQDYSITLVR